MGPISDQSMRVPFIAIVPSCGRAQRPRSLSSHVAKDALGERDEVRAVRRIGLAKLQCAIGCVLARDDLTAHGGGTGFDHPPRSPLGHRTPVVPETIRLSSLIHVLFEDQSGEAATVVGIPSVIAGKIGGVLHVDLDSGRADAIAVVLVEPGAGWCVVFVAVDDVGVRPGCSTAFSAHVTQPAALGAVWQFLRDIRDAETVFAGVDLDIAGLLTR